MLRSQMSAAAAICLLSASACPQALAQFQPATHQITIARHERVDLTAARADAILGEATTALQTDDDGPGDAGPRDDISCPVTLQRNGDIGTFAAPIDLASAANWARLRELPGSVKVVRSVTWCDGPTNNSIGCGLTPGPMFVVRRYLVNGGAYEFKLWAHEFGHNTGLGHNRRNPGAIMWQGAANRREVDADACRSFLRGRRTGRGILMAEAEVQQISEQLPIAAFVREVWIEGVPFGMAASYPSTTAPLLLRVLAENDLHVAANAAAVLGATGAAEARQPIIDYMRRSDMIDLLIQGDPSLHVSAIYSLGWLAHTSGDQQVFEFLVRAARRDTWIALSDRLGSVSDPDWWIPLVRAVVYAIAMSGHPDAQLPSAADVMGGTAAPEALTIMMNEVLLEAHHIYEVTSSRGLATYYREERNDQ